MRGVVGSDMGKVFSNKFSVFSKVEDSPWIRGYRRNVGCCQRGKEEGRGHGEGLKVKKDEEKREEKR